VLRKRFFSTSLTTPLAAGPKHAVLATGPTRSTEPVQRGPILLTDSCVASPRIWRTGIRSSMAGNVPVSGMTEDFSRTGRGHVPPVEPRKGSSLPTCESPAEPSAQPCHVRRTSAGHFNNRVTTQARGFEGVTSCLQTIQNTKAGPFPPREPSRSQGGDPIRTPAHSKDSHPHKPSHRQPIAEADNLDVRPGTLATHDMDVVCSGTGLADRFVSGGQPLEEVADSRNADWIESILCDADGAKTCLDENAPNDSGVAISPAPELLSSVSISETPAIEPEARLSNKHSYWLYGNGFWGGSRTHPRPRGRQQDEESLWIR